MNLEDIIAKNKEKYAEKLKKKGVLAQGIDKKINSVKGVSDNKQTVKEATAKSEEQIKADKQKAEEYLKKSQKTNKGDGSKKSLAERVNMVKDYNERNNK